MRDDLVDLVKRLDTLANDVFALGYTGLVTTLRDASAAVVKLNSALRHMEPSSKQRKRQRYLAKRAERRAQAGE